MLFPSRSVLISKRMSGFRTLSSSVCITRDAGSTSRNGKRWLVSGLGSTSPHFDWGRPRQRSPAQPPRAAPPPWPSARPVPGQRPPRSRRPGCWHTRSHNSGGQHIRAATRLLVSRAGRDRRQVRLGVRDAHVLGLRAVNRVSEPPPSDRLEAIAVTALRMMPRQAAPAGELIADGQSSA